MIHQKKGLNIIFYLFLLLLLVDYVEFLSKFMNFYYFHVMRLFLTGMLLVAMGYFLGIKKVGLIVLFLFSLTMFILSYIFVWNY